MTERPWAVVFLTWALYQSSSGFLALFLINRWLLLWVDGPVKSAAIGATGLASIGFAIGSVRGLWLTTMVIPLALLSMFAVGEVRRAYLRASYRGQGGGIGSAEPTRLWHPVTTMDVVTRHYTIVADIGGDGLRIAQLSDLHFNLALPEAYFKDVFEKVQAASPDLLVLTGDFISRAEYLPILKRLLPLVPKARLGTYFILGNHDYWTKIPEQIRQEFALAKIAPLSGRCEAIPCFGPRRLVLCGTEKPWGPSAVLATTNTDDYVVVLSHTPDNVYEWSDRADVMFAGHTHGGQLRLPALGAVVVPSRYGRRFDCGKFNVNRTHLFVSSGIGVDRPCMRVFCPPEIVILDIASQKSLCRAMNSPASQVS